MLPERLGLTLKSAKDIVDATARYTRDYIDDETFTHFMTLAGSDDLDNYPSFLYPNVGG